METAYGSGALTPILETDRLLLRGHATTDFDDCLAKWSDPEVTRHIFGKPLSGEEVWARLLRHAGHWALLGFGVWLVAEKDTGAFVGEVGFLNARRQTEPLVESSPEIGWSLARWAWGQGFAIEAVRAALAWADGHFDAAGTGCLIDPDNVPSLRLAQRCGYKEVCQTHYRDRPHTFFHRVPSR